MDNISKQEKEFLRKVYCKASYLECEKRQQDLIKENEKRIRIRKIKDCLIFSFLFIVMVLVSYANHFDFGVIIVCPSVFMLVISFYEFNSISEVKDYKYEVEV